MSVISAVFGIFAYCYSSWILLNFYFWIIDIPLPVALENYFLSCKIDSPVREVMVVAALKNFGIFLGFAIAHILFARPWYKKLSEKYFYAFKYERSVYNLQSSALLHTLMVYWSPMPVLYEIKDPMVELILGKIIPTVGFLFLFISTFQIDHFELFGLKQALELEIPEITFKTNGFYKYVRHPMMTGFMIFVNFHNIISFGRILLALMIDIFIVYAVYKYEEPELVKILGKKYSDYQKNVSAFVPSLGVTKFLSNKKD